MTPLVGITGPPSTRKDEAVRWLLTLRRSDLDEVVKAIDECGGRRCDDQIPLGDTELTLKVEGPGEMAQRLRAKPEVLGVYPDSDLELH